MKGFTLIELLIVLAILLIVSALSIPFPQTFQTSSDAHTHADTILKTVRRAQAQAIAGQNDSSWGVYFNDAAKEFILFKGINYASRDTDYDQVIEYPQAMTLTTDFGDEVVFTNYAGISSVSGTAQLLGSNGETHIISISDNDKIEISN